MSNVAERIDKYLRVENERKSAEHESSGKLSASMLGKPLLEQCLKLIGVPPKPVDDYVLKLFKRGDSVEDDIIDMLEIPKKDRQVEVEYRNTVGLVDFIENTIPNEIKSTKSSGWKWLEKSGAKPAHKLQAGLYALALDTESYRVIYVNSDDYRILEFTENTKDIKDEIDNVIDEVYGQLKSHKLPKFVAREKWQESSQYSSYPDWIHLDEPMDKLKRSYPDAYNKLTKWK